MLKRDLQGNGKLSGQMVGGVADGGAGDQKLSAGPKALLPALRFNLIQRFVEEIAFPLKIHQIGRLVMDIKYRNIVQLDRYDLLLVVDQYARGLSGLNLG